MPETELKPWKQIRQLLLEDDRQRLNDFVQGLGSDDMLRVVSRLNEQEQVALFQQLNFQTAADVIEEFPDVQAAELLDDLPADNAAHIVEAISSDSQADILSEMSSEFASAILEEMDEEDAAETRRLLEYPADTAGGLMQTEFISYSRSMTIRAVLEDMAERESEYAQYGAPYIYVVASRAKLLGVVRLRDIVFRDPETPLHEILKPVRSVSVHTEMDDLLRFFNDSELSAVPVVNERGYIIGVVKHHALDEALTERSESERLRQAGIIGGEELRYMPLALRSRRRLSWLSINIVLNLIAASVIALYQDTLSAVIALAIFLPIVSDMSGCSGNQAVAVSLRELSLGVVVPRDWLRVWRKEAAVGLINGLALGALIALAASLWQGSPWLGAVVGAALAINTILAVSIGGTVPLLLRSIGVDPALAAGPILTTVTDMCGFALVLGLATLALPMLT